MGSIDSHHVLTVVGSQTSRRTTSLDHDGVALDDLETLASAGGNRIRTDVSNAYQGNAETIAACLTDDELVELHIANAARDVHFH